MKNYKDSTLILLLTPFVFSFALGLDIYIPLIPQMTKIFNTTPSMVQLTMSLFLLITGLGQLLVGPLSDRFGRRPILFASAICYSLGAVGSVYSQAIEWLIFARIITAFGACGMLVTSFALVRDLYTQDKSAKIYSFLNGAIGISPTFAPILGGHLAWYFGWQSVFWMLAFTGLVAFLITKTFISETLEEEHKVPLDKNITKRYLSVIKNKQLLNYAFLSGLAESIFFCFFSISPFIIIELHQVPAHEFGYYFALFGSVIGIGGFASGKLVEKFGSQVTILAGICLMFLGGFSMLYWNYFYEASLQAFLIPMAIACSGSMFLVGCSASKALEPFETMAGTASSIFGAITFSMSALAGSLLMGLANPGPLPYSLLILVIAVFCLGLYLKVKDERCVTLN